MRKRKIKDSTVIIKIDEYFGAQEALGNVTLYPFGDY